MKKLLLLLAFCAVSTFAAEVPNLIPVPFKAGWWNPAASKITVAADGVITITANTDPKVNSYQKAQGRVALKGAALQNKKFEFSFKYRTAKFSGALQMAVRQIYAKTGNYYGFNLKKWDASKEWKECKTVFTTRKDARELNIYIVGRYMQEGEKVEIKDLKLVAK